MIKEMNQIYKQYLYLGKETYRPLRRPYGGPNGSLLWPTVVPSMVPSVVPSMTYCVLLILTWSCVPMCAILGK